LINRLTALRTGNASRDSNSQQTWSEENLVPFQKEPVLVLLAVKLGRMEVQTAQGGAECV